MVIYQIFHGENGFTEMSTPFVRANETFINRGATLDSLKVKCTCNAERSLRGIMSRNRTSEMDEDRVSELSKRLNEKEKKLYQCPGNKPWYGSEKDKEDCSSYPIAVLKFYKCVLS